MISLLNMIVVQIVNFLKGRESAYSYRRDWRECCFDDEQARKVQTEIMHEWNRHMY